MIGQNTEVYSEFIAESKENSYSYNNNPLKFYNKNLNSSQIDAIEFCLQTNELGLIHGPPGTGKTTTVVELILQAVNLGKKILVVAPSNIAVDNIAEKILSFRDDDNKRNYNDNENKIDFEICRIGHPARMLESILSISLSKKVEECAFMKGQKDLKKKLEKLRKELMSLKKYDNDKKRGLKDEMRVLQDDIKGAYRNSVFEVYNKSKVILATLVGAADFYLKEFLKRRNEEVFDMVIIDECAQGTEASCWISILQAKK
jgi:ATP-dependent RNA/DNA helicase IGHMBP2